MSRYDVLLTPQSSTPRPSGTPTYPGNQPAAAPSPPVTQPAETLPSAGQSAEQDPRVSAHPGRRPVRTGVRLPLKRTITRHAFELYRDQIDTLQRYRLEELNRGEGGSMSQMVREALDAYIADREGRR